MLTQDNQRYDGLIYIGKHQSFLNDLPSINFYVFAANDIIMLSSN